MWGHFTLVRQAEKGEKSKKARMHGPCSSALAEKCKSSPGASLSMYYGFKKKWDIQPLSGREFTCAAFSSVYGSACRNGARRCSSSGVEGHGQVGCAVGVRSDCRRSGLRLQTEPWGPDGILLPPAGHRYALWSTALFTLPDYFFCNANSILPQRRLWRPLPEHAIHLEG